MCGILGSINKEITKEQLASISHRGPDRQDVKNFYVGEHSVSLGHVRLSIVDLSDTGNQPMLSECGNYCLIYNGEIYNYKELAKRFLKKDLKGHSDTEVLLYLLIEHGIDILKMLNGIFSFAFYDLRKGELLLVRDPFGVKPLYYYRKNNYFIFSSEVRPILFSNNLGVDGNAVYTLVDIGYLPSPMCMYENVYKVRPGHYLRLFLKKDIEIETHCYRNYSVPKINISFAEAVEEYGILMEKAVERQLMSDVDLGVFLSGGIDSALIALLAGGKKSLNAYTVGFENECEEDEIYWASETAKIVGVEHKYIKIGSGDLFDIFSKCAEILEEPIATTSTIPMYYLSQLASKDVKVVLSGQGADEILGGYGRYNNEVRFNQNYCTFYRAAWKLFEMNKRWLKRGGTNFYRMSLNNDIHRFTPGNPFLINFFKSIGSYTVIKKNLDDIFSYNYDLLACSQLESTAERLMKMDTFAALPDNLLFYTDKITMSHSIECRVPMLDLELVRFIESLPSNYKITEIHNKIIHKEFAKQVLPDSIINRKKYGFQSPVQKWFVEKKVEIQELLIEGGNNLFKYFPEKAVQDIITQYFKGDRRNEKLLFQLLALSFWLNDKKQSNV